MIRTAVPEDAQAFLDVFAAVAAEDLWIGPQAPIDRAAHQERFEGRLVDPNAIVLVAEEEGLIVGGLNADLRYAVTELGMFIAVGWRGRGLGKALLEAALGWAMEQRSHKVTLEAWPHNTAAIGLYESVGFVLEGRRRRHWRRRNGALWDSLLMGLVLDETAPGSPHPG